VGEIGSKRFQKGNGVTIEFSKDVVFWFYCGVPGGGQKTNGSGPLAKRAAKGIFGRPGKKLAQKGLVGSSKVKKAPTLGVFL